MIITAWILLVMFGLLGLLLTKKYMFSQTKLGAYIAVFLTVAINFVITALSAGVIWGGLFQ